MKFTSNSYSIVVNEASLIKFYTYLIWFAKNDINLEANVESKIYEMVLIELAY